MSNYVGRQARPGSPQSTLIGGRPGAATYAQALPEKPKDLTGAFIINWSKTEGPDKTVAE